MKTLNPIHKGKQLNISLAFPNHSLILNPEKTMLTFLYLSIGIALLILSTIFEVKGQSYVKVKIDYNNNEHSLKKRFIGGETMANIVKGDISSKEEKPSTFIDSSFKRSVVDQKDIAVNYLRKSKITTVANSSNGIVKIVGSCWNRYVEQVAESNIHHDNVDSVNPYTVQPSVFDVLIYPSPAAEYVVIMWDVDNPTLNIEIVDSMGIVLISKTIQKGERIDISKLPDGVYSCRPAENNAIILSGASGNFVIHK